MITSLLLATALGGALAQDDLEMPDIPPLTPADFEGWERRYRRRMTASQVGLVFAATGPPLVLAGLGAALLSPDATVDDISRGAVWGGLAGMVIGVPLVGVWQFRAASAVGVLGKRPAIWPGVAAWLSLGSAMITLPILLDPDDPRPAIYAIAAHYYGFVLFGAGQLLTNGTAHRRAPQSSDALAKTGRPEAVWAITPLFSGRVASLGVIARW